MTKREVCNNVLEQIKKGTVKQKSKWEFTVRRLALALGFLLTIICGALATATTIFLVRANDWEFREDLGIGFISFFVKSLPFFWLLMFVLFITAAYFELKQTKKGYKYELTSIVAVVIIVSTSLGFILHLAGAGKKLDQIALDSLPPYEKLVKGPQFEIWLSPEQGFLAGKIIEVNDRQSVILIDYAEQEWQVILPTVQRPRVLQTGIIIKAVGQVTSDRVFEARRIEPWNHNIRKAQADKFRFLKENLPDLRTN